MPCSEPTNHGLIACKGMHHRGANAVAAGSCRACTLTTASGNYGTTSTAAVPSLQQQVIGRNPGAYLASAKTSTSTASSMNMRLPVLMRNDRDWLSCSALKKRARPTIPARIK